MATNKITKTQTACPDCKVGCQRFGKHRNGLQRYRCPACGKTYTPQHTNPLGSMTIPIDKAVLAIQLLVEGSSVRTTERITGIHRDTILRLLVLVGEKCERIMDAKMRNLNCQLIQVDEIWSFVGKKQKRVKATDPAEFGDQYVFVAIDAETKLIPCFRVGKRNFATTWEFISDLRNRVTGRIQLTSDAFKPYINAVEDAFGSNVDYAQLLKVYGSNPEPGRERYSPSRIVSTASVVFQGDPVSDLICTSHIERQNLTMRMSIRRFTRLTNAFSKKLRNLKAAVALHFAYYNFCRIHRSLRVTPAMQAGISDHVWTVAEIVGMFDT